MTSQQHHHPSSQPSQSSPSSLSSGSITISCDTCIMRATVACDDCMVTAMYGMVEHQAVVLDLAEQRAVRLLVDAGMVPALRHREAI